MVLDPLGQINLVTIGAILVIFLMTLLGLRRICLVPLIEVMERRDARIEAARARKAEADELLARAEQEAAQVLSRAKEEADQLVAKLAEETAALRNARLARAAAEVESILAAGRDELAALRRTEDARLAAELCTSVTGTLTRMIGPVEATTVRFLVARTLAREEAR
jgi:F0F1-type ATP synthase membrane subunit b/b'